MLTTLSGNPIPQTSELPRIVLKLILSRQTGSMRTLDPPPADDHSLRAGQTIEPGAGQPSRDLRVQNARREIAERRRVTRRLREALATQGFVLHYQPQVHLASGALRGGEALIRLQHRRRGLILPNHFMPVAERSDVIHDIGGWAINEACRQAARWPPQLCIAISLCVRQLQSGKLIKYLIEALSQSGLAAERLELELTEAMLIGDDEDTLFSLRALQGLGVRLAIDQFGAGYASLSALKRLPLSTLKLDKSLIQDVSGGLADAAIVGAVIEAGHALRCSILANGVESEAQLQALRKLGCDSGQGPLFGQPLAAEDFRQMVSQG